MDKNIYERLIDFASRINAQPIDLLVAADKMVREAIVKKVEATEGKRINFNGGNRPTAIANLGNEWGEVWIDAAYISDNGELMFDGTSVTNDDDQYEFDAYDFTYGSLHEIVA